MGIHKKILPNIAYQLFLILSITSTSFFLIGLATLIGAVLIILNINQINNLNSIQRIYVSSILVLTLVMSLINFPSQPIILFHFIIGLISILLATIFIQDLKVFYKSSLITLYIIQIGLIFYAVFIRGFDGFPSEIPIANIFGTSSANGITSYIIILQVLVCIVSFLQYRKIDFTPIILTIVIAIIGYGRGSIVAGLLILIISLFSVSAIKNRVILFFSVFALIILISVNYYYDEIKLFLEANTKISAGMVDDSRVEILEDYINKITLDTFFLGASYENTSIELKYGGNPHNSFIRAHHIFGIFYLILILIPVVMAFLSKFVIDIFISFSLLLILYFRAFSEPIIAPTILDFYYFSIVLIIIEPIRLNLKNTN